MLQCAWASMRARRGMDHMWHKFRYMSICHGRPLNFVLKMELIITRCYCIENKIDI
jgi:hypothetical protein